MDLHALHLAAVHTASLRGAQLDYGTAAFISVETNSPAVDSFRFMMQLQQEERVERIGFKILVDSAWVFYRYTTTNDHVYNVAVGFMYPICVPEVIWL